MNVVEHVTTAMGTTVVIRVVGVDAAVANARIARALTWFTEVESACSRFDPGSELSRVVAAGAASSPVAPLLFDLLAFALEVAAATGGAFDPTVGGAMLARGSDVAWRTGTRVSPGAVDADASWRDVVLERATRTVTLARPLALDLGAVAKGLAVDLAARDLADLGHYAIDAGGDVYVAGRNAEGATWTVGVRHPRMPGRLLTRVALRDAAICTSGDYERRLADGLPHIQDPRSGAPAAQVASASVVAERAVIADALATAALVMGPEAGLALLESQGVEGLLVTPDLREFATSGWRALVRAA